MSDATPSPAGFGGEAYLRSLIRSLPDLLFVIDREGRFLDYKADARDLYVRPESFLGRHFRDVLPPGVAAQLAGAVAATTTTGGMVRVEYDIPIGDVVHSFAGTVVAFGEGNVVATIRDVTEQRRMEEGLRNEMALQNLLMTIASKYINTRPDEVSTAIHGSLAEIARFVDADRSYIFDYDWGRLCCSNTYEWCADGITPQIDLLQDVHLDRVPQWVDTHQRGETMYVPDVLALPEDDGLRALLEPQDIKSLIAIPIADAGRCVGFVGFDSVRQHHRYSERERILLSVFAEILVNIRTRATLEERLVEESHKAQAANRAKSQFLANMSHELRTPLNGVIGMTSLLLDSPLDDDQRLYAEIAHSSGEALLTLVNDILDISKVEAGRLDLEVVEFDVADLLDDFAASLAPRAREKGIELVCAVEPGVPTLLRGDPGRLRQVLNNLAGNAIKFTTAGEVLVGVRTEAGGGGAVVLRFAVRDTGIGIPRDQMGRLFEKFMQADSSTTRKYGGTGLGLAISRQLAELMGGTIGASSEEGRGSEFWFTARFDVAPFPGVDGDGAGTNLAHLRALVVDDVSTSRRTLTARLAHLGLRTTAAADGPGALAVLHAAAAAGDPFQVVIIEKRMPRMDGVSLGRAIQADPRLAATPVILLTAMGSRDDAEEAQRHGFAGCIARPVRQRELVSVLTAVCSGAEAPDDRRAVPPCGARARLSMFDDCKARVLLVEDNTTNQLVALALLKKLGLRAEAAADGAEALRALESMPYDLVLMDVQMPVMDGLEATRRIRSPLSSVRNHTVPVIAMTAHAVHGDRERFLAAGMDGYISKPVTPEALAEALEPWLRGRQAGRRR